MYLYEFGNGIQNSILFLPPLKLNLSVYSGSLAYLASGPFFGGISPVYDARI